MYALCIGATEIPSNGSIPFHSPGKQDACEGYPWLGIAPSACLTWAQGPVPRSKGLDLRAPNLRHNPMVQHATSTINKNNCLAHFLKPTWLLHACWQGDKGASSQQRGTAYSAPKRHHPSQPGPLPPCVGLCALPHALCMPYGYVHTAQPLSDAMHRSLCSGTWCHRPLTTDVCRCCLKF